MVHCFQHRGEKRLERFENDNPMRLDKFLKSVRIVKRRSVAKEICEHGMVHVNGRPARGGKTVRAGDRIQIDFYNRELTVRIEELPPGNIPKERAPDYYSILLDRRKPPEWQEDFHQFER